MDAFDDYRASTVDANALHALLVGTDTLQELLGALTIRAAQDTAHGCAITVRDDAGRPYTVASSDEMTRELDELQYAGGSGPCLQALETALPVVVIDMAAETRWAPYPQRAVEVGARSSMSYPLITDETAIGALNLYCFVAPSPAGEVRAQAARIAEHAAGAVALARRLAPQSRAIDSLRTTLISRSTIDQAIGILMAEQRWDAQRAFDLLRQASQARNVKLREVAAGIVAGVGRTPPGRRGRY